MNPQGIFDVIVIGAGSIGTPAAMYMAQAGLKVLVVDQFASPGQGSNKAAIGGVRATHSDPAKIRLGLQSTKVFSTWQEEHGRISSGTAVVTVLSPIPNRMKNPSRICWSSKNHTA
jgi:Glycine/D-amino acid oxidases (deaminating)